MTARSRPAVEVQGLTISAADGRGGRVALVEDVSFQLARGEVLALVGESGSGKTTIALSLLGYVRSGCRIDAGSIRVGDTDIRALQPAALRKLRRQQISYVAQSAASALNPAQKLLAQVTESTRLAGRLTTAEANTKARGIFRALQLPDPDHVGDRYLHQLSGGQLQRVMIAMALMSDPVLIILDEPTTALDVTTQLEVLRSLKRALQDSNATALYVSHDLAVVAQLADTVLVLRQGRVQESARITKLLQSPDSDYTRQLLAAARPARTDSSSPITKAALNNSLLTINGLTTGYRQEPALRDFSLDVPRGAAIGIIGESGSGKTTLARVIAGLMPPWHGSLTFDGAALPATVRERRSEHFRRIQIVFQNADTALNPAHTVETVLGRPLQLYQSLTPDARTKRIAQLLDLVQLPQTVAQRNTHELSGGQKQRVNLARALAAQPDLLLCDEITSALDTLVAAAILDLIAQLRRELGLTLLFISHDLHAVKVVCDSVVVLKSGRQLDYKTVADLERPPQHPYLRRLLNAIPSLQPGWLAATEHLESNMVANESRMVRLAETERQSVTIDVDGQAVVALQGDTLLVAMLTSGSTLRQSEFGDGARAGFCLMGACQDCWVWTPDGNRLRACSTMVRPGIAVRTSQPEATWSHHAL